MNDHVQIGTVLPLEIEVAEDGTPKDLSAVSALTVVLRLAADPTVRFTKPGTDTVLTDLTHRVTATVQPTDFTLPGRWQLQVTWTDGTGPRKSTLVDFFVDTNL